MESQQEAEICRRGFLRAKPSGHSSSHVTFLIYKNYSSQHSKKLPGPWACGASRLTLALTFVLESGGHSEWKRVEYTDV